MLGEKKLFTLMPAAVRKEIVNIKQNLFHPGTPKTAEALKAVYCQGYP